jgi:protein-S-isoprenylcysteine O-methyltransferase Ste14
MTDAPESNARGLVRAIVSLPPVLLILAGLLFVPAGTLVWARGWWFLAATLIAMSVAIAYLWRANPDIFTARSSVKQGTKGWDLALLPLVIGSLLAVIVVAALDDGRFDWLAMPDWVVWLGYVLFFAGFALMTWAQAVNRHFEPGVRIQTDRAHRVVDVGPYAIIRHPGYAASIPFAAGMALALGSLWALVPVAVLLLTLAYRTVREEETLRAELPGYADYARRVTYRWVPGVW